MLNICKAQIANIVQIWLKALIVWVYNGFIVWFCNAQVITITSEKETDGFFAPSITIMAMDAEGWRGNLPFEKCQKSQN